MKFNLFKDIELTLKKRDGFLRQNLQPGRVDRGGATCHVAGAKRVWIESSLIPKKSLTAI